MAMVSKARTMKRRLEEQDFISRLPDVILGDIISLLPTKAGARTQVLSSRWRHLWRSALLNIELDQGHDIWRQIQQRQVAGILSSHPGPALRFSMPIDYFADDDDPAAATLDGWLRAPALDKLQELEILYRCWVPPGRRNQRPPLPVSAHRFSSTLRVASFGGCSFPDWDAGGALHLPHVKQLSLFNVRISKSSLHGLLASCPVLQSLMLAENIAGCSCIIIASHTIRSIGVRPCPSSSLSGGAMLQQLIIEDAPCLERLLHFGQLFGKNMVISVISAPKLYVLGQHPIEHQPTLKFATTVFQGSRVVNSTMPVPSVKVLALTHNHLSLDMVIDFMKCFPCLENLHLKMTKMDSESSKVTNAWRHKHRNLIGTLDIRLKKIVVTVYRGNSAHVNFAKFFVLNARVLESMVLVLEVARINNNKARIEKQKKLLQIENRASRGAHFHFVDHFGRSTSPECIWSEQVHDLSTVDPFARFDRWT